jgi:hypothetical protein
VNDLGCYPVRMFAVEESDRLTFDLGDLYEANTLLRWHHYLGPTSRARHVFVATRGALVVAAQTWRLPAARHLPNDGTWLELSRWCLTPHAGKNAGSQQHGWVRRWLTANSEATTLVSYSDPSAGHTGSLYRACNWTWAPTWHRLRPPPTGGGSWDGRTQQAVKDRWVFPLRADGRRAEVLSLKDAAAERLLAGRVVA